MLYCTHCKLKISGERTNCPLCKMPLCSGTPCEETFPEVLPKNRSLHLFWRILLFLSIAACIICATINYSIPESGQWSLFVIAGVACMWVSISTAVKKRHNIYKNILWQVAVISSLAVMWDFITGWHGWSLDFVIPGVCTCAVLTLSITARCMHLHIEDYLVYLLIDVLFGIVPLIFLAFNLVHFTYPSVICVAICLLYLAALFVFEGKNITAEIKKRLHL